MSNKLPHPQVMTWEQLEAEIVESREVAARLIRDTGFMAEQIAILRDQQRTVESERWKFFEEGDGESVL